jgi:hypothetical protein
VAELRENKYVLWENGNGMIGTDLSTPAAIGALLLVHHRDRYEDRLASGNNRLYEKVSVRLLHVAIKELHRPRAPEEKGKARRHQSLAGATFAAGN